jgi:hypothetical protein
MATHKVTFPRSMTIALENRHSLSPPKTQEPIAAALRIAGNPNVPKKMAEAQLPTGTGHVRDDRHLALGVGEQLRGGHAERVHAVRALVVERVEDLRERFRRGKHVPALHRPLEKITRDGLCQKRVATVTKMKTIVLIA